MIQTPAELKGLWHWPTMETQTCDHSTTETTYNSSLCNSETSWDKTRSLQLQEACCFKPSPVPLHVLCVLLWFDFYRTNLLWAQNSWRIITGGETKYWKRIKWIHFWQNTLPLCTMLVQYEVSQCFVSFWCLYRLYYTTYTWVLFFYDAAWSLFLKLTIIGFFFFFFNHWIQTFCVASVDHTHFGSWGSAAVIYCSYFVICICHNCVLNGL